MSRDSVACVTSNPSALIRRRSCSWLRMGSRWTMSRMIACLRDFISMHRQPSNYTPALTFLCNSPYKYSSAAMKESVTVVSPSATSVAIAGATGYAGQELVRLLARHPVASLSVAMSSGATSAPRPLPALARIWDDPVVPLDVDRIAADAEVAFLALPEAAAAELGAALVVRGVRVIDLSGAFRLRDAAARQKFYPATSELPEGVVYGIPERHRDAIRTARLISCPGCYPTAALLALEPLVAAGAIQGAVVIDAKSGISGAGKTPSDRTHFSENHGSVAAYGVFSHRHTAEIEQELEMAVTFVPHLVPLDRGILETIYVTLRPGTSEAQVAAVLQRA